MPTRKLTANGSPKERILRAAYDLIAQKGITAVGINEIIESAECAKASLYDNFGSKEILTLACLEQRERLWIREWLETEINGRAATPVARLLVMFDVLDDWFLHRKYAACPFIRVLLEPGVSVLERKAAINHLKTLRSIIAIHAEDARLADPQRFARIWHMLINGAMIAASEGSRSAGADAKIGAELILKSWARNRSGSRAKRKSDN